MCANSIDPEGYKQASSSLNRHTTQCCTCGNATCKDHYLLLCINCAQLFAFQNPQKPEVDDWKYAPVSILENLSTAKKLQSVLVKNLQRSSKNKIWLLTYFL